MKRLKNGWGVILAGCVVLAAPTLGQAPAETVPAEEPAMDEVQPAATEPSPAAGEGVAGRRDPFRPFLLNLAAQGGERDVPRVGVTAYEVHQLRLVAVLWEMKPPRALLQDSGGMGYIITPGTPVGRRGGVVAAIEPGRVIVEEKQLDFYGREQVRTEVLEIPKELEPQAVGRE